MEQLLYRYAWLIPVLPLISSLVMGIGLITFREATQSLRRDLAFFTIGLLGISVIQSFGILYFQLNGLYQEGKVKYLMLMKMKFY